MFLYLKQVCKLFLVTAIVFLSSSCSFISQDVKELIQLPQTACDESEIMQLIYQHTSEQKYDLIFPQEGNHRCAVTIRDTQQGNKFAVAFYSIRNTSEKNIHMLVMAQYPDKWNIVFDETLNCSKINKLDFCDVCNIGFEQIIVSYNSYNEAINSISIYNYCADEMSPKLVNIFQNHDDFDVYDYNNDGKLDMLLVDLSNSATLLNYSKANNSFESIGNVKLDSASLQHKNCICGKINNDTKAYFIDALTTDNRIFTQFIYWDNTTHALVNPFYSQDVSMNPSMRKSVLQDKLYSADIDGDNIIEIPIVENINAIIDGAFSKDTQSVYNFISWNNFDTQQNLLCSKINTIVDEQNGFYIITPQNWKDRVLIIKDNKENSLIFKELQQQENILVPTEEFMKIKVFSANDWQSLSDESYVKISDIGDKVCAVKFTDKSKLYNIDIDYLLDNFKFL